MGLIEWLIKTHMEQNHFQTSIFQSHRFVSFSIDNPPCNSECREDVVFKNLLKMCHGLEDRLLASSPEEIEQIGDLVIISNLQYFLLLTLLQLRFKRVLINPAPMTQKE